MRSLSLASVRFRKRGDGEQIRDKTVAAWTTMIEPKSTRRPTASRMSASIYALKTPQMMRAGEIQQAVNIVRIWTMKEGCKDQNGAFSKLDEVVGFGGVGTCQAARPKAQLWGLGAVGRGRRRTPQSQE